MLNRNLREEYRRDLEARNNYYFQETMAPPLAQTDTSIDKD
jgi:hypothetical protein